MSYIQVKIGPLKKDKDGNDIPDSNLRGLKFNQYANTIAVESVDQRHPGASSKIAIVYAGLCGNCYVERIEPDFTFKDVAEWVEDIDEDTVLLIYKTYVSTKDWQKNNPGNDALADLEAVENKKKELKLSQENIVPSALE